MCKGCVAEHVATGRAPLVALGMGTCKALVLLSPPPHQMPLCSVQDRRSELGSVVRGFPNLLEPLGGGSGDGDVVGGCGRGVGGAGTGVPADQHGDRLGTRERGWPLPGVLAAVGKLRHGAVSPRDDRRALQLS